MSTPPTLLFRGMAHFTFTFGLDTYRGWQMSVSRPPSAAPSLVTASRQPSVELTPPTPGTARTRCRDCRLTIDSRHAIYRHQPVRRAAANTKIKPIRSSVIAAFTVRRFYEQVVALDLSHFSHIQRVK